MAPQRKDFISFLLATEKPTAEAKKLTAEFLKVKGDTNLYEFFKKHKYTDISVEECMEIWKFMRDRNAFIHNLPSDIECDPSVKGY